MTLTCLPFYHCVAQKFLVTTFTSRLQKKTQHGATLKIFPFDGTHNDDYFEVCEPVHKLFETCFDTASSWFLTRIFRVTKPQHLTQAVQRSDTKVGLSLGRPGNKSSYNREHQKINELAN